MTLTIEEIRDAICKSMSMATQSIGFDSKENELWWFNGYIESAIDIMDLIVTEISKCYGRYDGALNDAKDELQKILEGELI